MVGGMGKLISRAQKIFNTVKIFSHIIMMNICPYTFI